MNIVYSVKYWYQTRSTCGIFLRSLLYRMLLAFSCRKVIHTHTYIHKQPCSGQSTGIRQATWQGRFQECSPGEGKCPSPSKYRAVNLTGLYTLMMWIFYDIFYVKNTILFIIIPTPVRCEGLAFSCYESPARFNEFATMLPVDFLLCNIWSMRHPIIYSMKLYANV